MSTLRGITVLDLSRVLAGPWATQLLADLGATVIKVEKPAQGDDTRAWGPPFASNLAYPEQRGESAYFLAANRGKQSIAVDMASAQGQQLLRRLAEKADVVVENFKVDALAKYGLSAADLLALNPRLVVCSITGFGQTGPLREHAGYDAMIQAMGGIMSITGEADGLPGAGPQKIGVAAADLMTGMYAGNAILAALLERERSGLGQHIDLALFDTQLAWLANQAMNYLVGGTPPTRLGTAHPNIVPYQAFAVRDGHLMLAVGNDQQFGKLVAAAGAAELANDPRFRTNAERVQNRSALLELLAPLLARRDLDDWLSTLGELGVPCGPINTLDRAFAEPQAQARQTVMQLPHSGAGTVPQIRNPIRFSRTPIEYQHGPPLLGEHTDQVLQTQLGLSPAEISALRAAKVIA
jgi:crotonobetainyl-CoA:carnitine CoA-transferase CaiB-like acyl-CoA transferase